MNDPTTLFPVEAQYRAALNSPNEREALMQIAAERKAAGDELWMDFHELAHTTDPELRRDFIDEIETAFARDRADESFDDACYAYEVRTGKEWDSSPVLFDREAWIERYIEGEAA